MIVNNQSQSSANLGAAALNNSSGLSNLKNTPASSTSGMGKSEFLTLFTTQLKSQDPLDPVKNEAFVAQLAQFSQLEAATNMSTSLEKMAASFQTSRFLSGSALIGKQVTVPMGDANYIKDNEISGLVSLPDGADKIQLDVYDKNNQKVYTQQIGKQAPGEVTLRWDGSLDNGSKADSGLYKIIATISSMGRNSQTALSTASTVKSVTYSKEVNDIIVEVVGGKTVPLSQVNRIE